MKVLLVVLFAIDSSKATLSLHERTLIQSVSRASPATFEHAVLERLDFCEAASTLKPSNALYHKAVQIMQEGAKNNMEFLHKLGNAFRSDDIRSRNEIDFFWNESIVSEIDNIIGAVGVDLDYHTEKSIPSKPIHPSEADQNKPRTYLGPGDSLDPADADKRIAHHSLVKDHLKNLQKELSELESEIESLFRDNGDEKSSYRVKWGAPKPDFESHAKSRFDELLLPDARRDAPIGGLPSQDGSDMQKGMGHSIFALIAEEGDGSGQLEEFLTRNDFGPVELMEGFTSLLSVLKIRDEALADAETSLLTLSEKIEAGMKYNAGEIEEDLFDNMEKKLWMMEDLAQAVFTDVARYPADYHVEIDFDADADLYESYKKQVQEKDDLISTHARINLLVNVAFRVHGHILGFFRAFTGESAVNPEKDLPTGEHGVASSLVEKSQGLPGRLEEISRNTNEIDIANAEKDFEIFVKSEPTKSATCLLYGRYDVLMQKLRQTTVGADEKQDARSGEKDLLCKGTQELGLKELRASAMNHFVILGLDSDAENIEEAFQARKESSNSGHLEEIRTAYDALKTKEERDAYRAQQKARRERFFAAKPRGAKNLND